MVFIFHTVSFVTAEVRDKPASGGSGIELYMGSIGVRIRTKGRKSFVSLGGCGT